MTELRMPRRKEVTGDASIWKRGIAFLLDLLVLDLVIARPFSGIIESIVPQSLEGQAAYDFMRSNPDLANRVFMVFMVVMFLSFLYFVLFEYFVQQTPGKMLTRLYVNSEDKKQKTTLWQCILRNLFLIPVFPLFLLWIVDPVFLLIRNRRLSEIISRTKVVEVYTI